MKRHSRDFWEELVRAVEAGAAPAAVARSHGVKEGTLRWWRSELERRARSSSAPRFLPVVVSGPIVTESTGSPIEIELDGVRLRVAPGTDVAYVGRLVRAVRSGC